MADKTPQEQVFENIRKDFGATEKKSKATDTGYTPLPMPADSSQTHMNDSQDDSKNAMAMKRAAADSAKAKYMQENKIDENGDPVK